MKRPQKILAALAVVLVIAAIALVQTFNVLAVRNRDQVQQELQKVLGKNVNFDSLEVHWLGQPGFVATEFRIADAAAARTRTRSRHKLVESSFSPACHRQTDFQWS
jgi:uncharacterized protein YhdP